MDTLRVDTRAAPPALEIAAARPAPAPERPRDSVPEARKPGGPESATHRSDSSTREKTPVENDGSARGDRVQEKDDQALREAVKALQDEMRSFDQHSIEITYDEEVDRFVVAIVDRETKEVIRQIPPESLLEANRRMHELRGLLFDDRS